MDNCLREAACSSSEATSSEESVILASARPKKRAGRRVFKETRHPVYRGVRRRNNKKWVCEVRVPNHKNSRIWLGTYSTPEMAARAHDVAALALRGKSACLNFADSAWRLPLPASTHAHEIRRVASLAAEAFGSEPTTDDYEVCSSSNTTSTSVIMGDANNVQDYEPMMSVSEYDHELHDLLLSMADEPLRSPPPFLRDGWGWNDMEVDTEVSLWQF